MKQIYYLLASVLMMFISIEGAEAATGDVITDLSSLSNSKCYTLTTARGKIVANAQKTDICSGNNSGASSEEADGQWAILKLNDTSYYLFNVGANQFLKSTSFNGADLGDVFTLSEGTTTSGTFLLKSGSNTLNINGEGNIVLNTWATEDDGNCITIAEAGDFDATDIGSLVTITYDYYINSQKVYTENRTAYQGLSYPTPTTWEYTETTTPTGTVQGSDNGTSINIPVTVSTSFPFKYGTEETAWSDLTWYRLKLNNKYVNYDGTDATTKLSLTNTLSAADYTNDYLAFAFIGDPVSGFRIVNYGKGDSYTLSNSNNPYDGNTGGSTFPTMKLITDLTLGTASGNDVNKYFIAKATDEAFFVQMKTYEGAANTYVRMNDRNSALAYWNSGSGTGSYFTVEQMIPGSVTSLDNIVAGQAYTITAAGGRSSFIYTDDKLTSTSKAGIAADPTDQKQQFMFEKINDNYYLYSVGAGAFIDVSGNYTAAVEGTPTNSVAFIASTNSNKSQYPTVLSINNKHIGISNSYNPAVISFWNDTSDDGNSLCIKAVAGVTYDRTELEKAKFTKAINDAITEAETNGKISVLFAAADVTTAKNSLNDLTYSESDGYFTNSKKIDPILDVLYKTAEGKKFSIRNYDDTYYLTTTKTELRGKESTLEKDGVFEVKYNGKKKFYLYGTYNNVYVNKPESSNTAPTTSATATNDFYIGVLSGSADNKVYFANAKSGNNSIHFNTNYTYYTCGWEYTAGASQWTISAVTDDQYNSFDAWEALSSAIEIAERYTFGTSLGEYSNGSSLAAAKTMLDAKTATADQVTSAIASISPSNLTLNMPVNGQFIRIKDSAGNYMTCNNTDSKIAFSADKDDSSIFCYTGSALVAYKTGYFASRSTSNSKTFPCNATSVTTESAETIYHIHASSLNKGKYLVSFGGDTRFMFTAANAGDFSGGATTVNQAGYEFTLEEVESVPVTISGAGMATLYSPMALTIPEGITAYTGNFDRESNCIKLTALEGTIPANTGVIIEGEAKSHDFATITTGNEGTSCLTGSTPGITCVTGAYTLQKVDGQLGFYKYTGTNLNGFKAYFVNSSGSKGFNIAVDNDPTGISSAKADTTGDGKYYDLLGNQVTTPIKGHIYILNGKKVLK